MSAIVAWEIGRLGSIITAGSAQSAGILGYGDPVLGLPGLRLYWPGHVNGAGNLLDVLMGHDYRLSDGGSPKVGSYNGTPYISFDGSADYFTHTDVNHFDLLGDEGFIETAIQGVTVGAWVYSTSFGTADFVVNKWGSVGDRGYDLRSQSFNITGNGSTIITAATTPPSNSTWHFCVGRFIPSTSVDFLLDMTKYTQSTSESSIYNSTADFYMGRLPAIGYSAIKLAKIWLAVANVSDAQLQYIYDLQAPLFA